MKCFFIFLFLIPSFLFSVESLHISNSLPTPVLLEQAKIFKDTEHLNYNDVYALLNQGKFEKLPLHVKSLGANNATYWIALKLKNTNPQELFIEFKYDQLARIECFVFKENQLIHSTINGNTIQLKEREVKDFFVRFSVLESDEPLTYLFKIIANRPIIIAMDIDTKAKLDSDKFIPIIVVALFSGCLFLLLLSNVILYGIFKLKEYLFYSIHLASFWIFIMYIHNYTFLILQDFLWVNTFIRVASSQGFHVALLLLSLYFLDIHRLSSLLVKMTYFLCIITVIVFFALDIHSSWQTIAFIAGIIVPSYCVFLGFVALCRKVLFAKLYLVGLLGFYSGALLFWLMQIGLIPVIAMGKNVLLLGSLWEMIIFTCMLLLKIRLMKLEHNRMKVQILEANKERLYQSRYISIGKTIGNVAHQWKQPLNGLGAILTYMKGSLVLETRVKKVKLIESLDMSFEIIKHLSETIDTFYSFLLQSYTNKNQFFVCEELESIQKMLDYSLKNSQIELRINKMANSIIRGNPNEFIQVILNILLNAKEEFDTVDHLAAVIDVNVDEKDEICVISIEDNAGGVTIKPIESIFEFNVTCKRDSAGVGLFICKDIIEIRFHGKIKVENKNGGTCFVIFIPLLNF